MKVSLIIFSLIISMSALAGPLNLRNDLALREHRAKQVYESSPDYYSPAQFAAAVAAAKNFGELQAIMLKMAQAEKAEAKAKQDAKTTSQKSGK